MGIDPRGNIDPDGVAYVPNPYDEIALEEALRIKEGMNRAQVALISMGPQRVERVLRYGLAMGGDWAIHIYGEKLENVNPWVRSKALVKAIENQRFDLILCGKKAIDDNEGVVGCYVAELLGLPYVASVTDVVLEPNGKKARMLQVLERGDRQLIECDLPALFSIERGLTKPRYPTFIGRLIGSKKEIFKVNSQELGISFLSSIEPEMKVVKVSVAKLKPKRVFTPESTLPAKERIKLIMSGGVVEKKSNLLRGSPQELAEVFIKFVEENRIIRKRPESVEKEKT
jgi:electron transfer flavoprotein beta subunit